MGDRPDESGDQLTRALSKTLNIKSANPTHYEILGIPPTESDPDAISNAADMRMAHVRTFQTSKEFGAAVQAILNKLSTARVVLLDEAKKSRYDESLAARTAQATTRKNVAAVVPAAVAPLPVAIPVARPLAAPAPAQPSPAVTAKTRAAVTTIAPSIVSPSPAPVAAPRAPAAAPASTMIGTLQTRWKETTAAVVATVGLAVGAATWLSTASGEGTNGKAVAKASENPERDTSRIAPVEPPAPVEPAEQEIPELELATEEYQEETIATENVEEDREPAASAYTPSFSESLPASPSASDAPATDILVSKPLAAEPSIENAVAMESSDTPNVAVKPVEKPLVSDETVEARRAALLARIGVANGAKPDQKQYGQIRDFANDATIKSDPATYKATILALVSASSALDDGMKMLDALGHVRGNPALFGQAEMLSLSKQTMKALAQDGKYVEAMKLLDELGGEKFLKDDEIAILQGAILRVASASKDVRLNPTERMNVARKMLDVARSTAEDDPNEANNLLMDAMKNFGTASDPAVRKSWFDQTKEVRAAIAEAKRFKEATAALAKDPTNADALSDVAEYEFANGNPAKGLEMMAGLPSTFPMGALAKNTNALLSTSDAGSAACLTCAEAWMKVAKNSDESKGRQEAAMQLATKLLQRAANSTDRDVISIASAKRQLTALGTPAPQAVPNVAQTPERATPPRTQKTAAENVRNKPVEVLGLVDLKTAALTGQWSKGQNGEIIGWPGKSTRLLLPWKVTPGKDFSFRMEMDVERRKGENGLQIMLPLGKGASIIVSGYPDRGGMTGITNIDGKSVDQNESKVMGKILTGGRHIVTIDIEQKGKEYAAMAFIDGKKVFEWKGDIDTLSHDTKASLEEGCVGVGSYETEIVFRSIRFQSLDKNADAGVSSLSKTK